MQTGKETKSRLRRLALLCLAIALVLTVSLLCGHFSGFFEKKPAAPIDAANTGGSDAVSAINANLPLWYAPQKLGVLTMTYGGEPGAGQLGETNIVADFPADTKITDNVNARFINISGDFIGTYFDVKTNDVFDLKQFIREAMGLNANADMVVEEYGVNEDYVTYTLLPEKKSYYLNRKTMEYKQLPVSLYGKVMDVSITDDYRCFLFSKIRGDTVYHDVILMDGSDLSYQVVSDGFNPSFDTRFSANEKFICFTVFKDGLSQGGDETVWILYNRETKKHIRQTGDLIKFINNDSLAVFYMGDNFKIIDTQDGTELSDKSAVTGLDRYYLNDRLVDFGEYRVNIFRKDIIDNTELELTKKEVKTFCVSKNGRYLYTYSDGDAYISYMDIETLESAELPIDSVFVEQVSALKENNRIIYILYVDETMTQALLCYYTIPYGDKKPQPITPDNGQNASGREQIDWDIRAHTAQETIDTFDYFYLTACQPYFYNPLNIGEDVMKNDDLCELIELLRELPYKERGGDRFSDNSKIFIFRASDPDNMIFETIDIGVTDSGKYYAYCEYTNIYCYISKQTYNRIYDICGRMVVFPTEPAVKPDNG